MHKLRKQKGKELEQEGTKGSEVTSSFFLLPGPGVYAKAKAFFSQQTVRSKSAAG